VQITTILSKNKKKKKKGKKEAGYLNCRYSQKWV